MQSILLITPDFLIILLGAALVAWLKYPKGFWQWAEKLVFYILFPPLLFTSIATSKLTLSTSTTFLAASIITMFLGVAAAWSVRWFVKADPVTHASVFQCAFRFNTYIGFALCSRIYGDEGFALLALLMAFWVPISNSIAVAALASAVAKRDATGSAAGGSVLSKTLRAIVTNPLIIATTLGLIVNIGQIHVPDVAMTFFKSLGNASLAMGLLCIGAGLKLDDMKSEFPLVAANTFERLMAVPFVAMLFCLVFGFSGPTMGALMIFAMLPTAQSCYVMTASMRGNAPLVAGITTAHTLAAIVTIPFWIWVITTLFA